jgi:hypothetical protein
MLYICFLTTILALMVHGEEVSLMVFGDTSGNRSALYQAKLIILFT